MINLDVYIIGFINGNWLTLMMALGLLKVVAKMTPWVGDDQIYTLLSGIFSSVRKPVQGGLPSMEERGEEVK